MGKTRFQEAMGAMYPSDYDEVETYNNGQPNFAGQGYKNIRDNFIPANADQELWTLALNEAQNVGDYASDQALFDSANNIYKQLGGITDYEKLLGRTDFDRALDAIGNAGDQFYGLLGNGMDFVFDNTIGNIAGALNRGWGEDVKGAFNGEDIKWIPSLLGDLALFAINPALGAVVGGTKAMIDNRDNWRMAANGIDPKTGEKLSDERRASALGAGALDTALYVIPGIAGERGLAKTLQRVAGMQNPARMRGLAEAAAGKAQAGIDTINAGRRAERAINKAGVPEINQAYDDAARLAQEEGLVLDAERFSSPEDMLNAFRQGEVEAAIANSPAARAIERAGGMRSGNEAARSIAAERAAGRSGRLAEGEELSKAAQTKNAAEAEMTDAQMLERLQAEQAAAKARQATWDARVGYATNPRGLGRGGIGNPRRYREIIDDIASGSDNVSTALAEGMGSDSRVVQNLVQRLTGKTPEQFMADARKAGTNAAKKKGAKQKLGDEAMRESVANAAPVFTGANEKVANLLLNGLQNSGRAAQGAAIGGLGMADLAAQLNAQGIDLGEYLYDSLVENPDIGSLGALGALGLAAIGRPGLRNAYRYMGNGIAPRANLAKLGGQAALGHYEGTAPMPMTADDLAYYNALLAGGSETDAYNAVANRSSSSSNRSSNGRSSDNGKKSSTGSTNGGVRYYY